MANNALPDGLVNLQQPLTAEQLREQPIDVQDVLDSTQNSTDQLGNNSVLTFEVQDSLFVMIDVDNTDPEDETIYRARVSLNDDAPSATKGFVCRSGQTTYLPFQIQGEVKVFAPLGTVVSVQTASRA